MRGAQLATWRGRNGPLTMRRSRRWLAPSSQTRRVVYWSAASPSGRALVRRAASRRLNRSSFSTLWQSAYRATSHVPDVVRSSGAVSRSRRKKSQGWAGFDIMSFANNPHRDAGYEAFFETLDHLHAHGIATCGAGEDLGQAREPAIVERDGTKVAFLGYSTILFPGYEARPGKPGCTPISVITDYAMSEIEQPGCEAVVTTVVHPSSLQLLREDITRARERADIVVISVHWGIHFTPVEVAQYESELGRAAIDAGADLVLGHHQHILKAIEV